MTVGTRFHAHHWRMVRTLNRKGVGFEILERCSRCQVFRDVLVHVDNSQRRAFTKLTAVYMAVDDGKDGKG